MGEKTRKNGKGVLMEGKCDMKRWDEVSAGVCAGFWECHFKRARGSTYGGYGDSLRV